MQNNDFKVMARIGGIDKSQIIAFLQSKGYAKTDKWDDLWQNAHGYAKTIAGETKLDVLTDVFSHIEDSLKTGATRQKTAVQIAEALVKKGWYFAGRGGSKKIDYTGILGALLPISDEDKHELEKHLMKGSVRRLKLIVRQNTQTAFMAGAYKTDQSIRDSHRALHHKIFRADDPIWDTIYPPNGFNCRCKVSALSERDMKRRGFSVDSATVKKEFIKKDKHGNDRYRYKITTDNDSEYIDDGFGYNAGKEMLRADRIFKKAVALPPQISSAVMSEMLSQPYFANRLYMQHRQWVDNIVSGNTELLKQADNIVTLGVFNAQLLQGLQHLNITPQSAVIAMSKGDLLHATRAKKQKQGIAVPIEFWQQLPKYLQKPTAVLLDTTQKYNALIYVYDIEKTKVVVTIDYTTKVSKQSAVVNMVTTGSVLKNINSLKRYKVVYGSL